MDLPNLLNKLTGSTNATVRFLAVDIGIGTVKTAMWQSDGVNTEVITIGSTQAWSINTPSELITAIDMSMNDATAGMDDDIEQAMIGLPDNWVDQNGVVAKFQPVITQISKQLELKIGGYVVTTEAFLQHLRSIEGGPTSAVFIRVFSETILVAFYYLGNLKGSQIVGRSTEIAKDVEEGLARMPLIGNLPSRMILLSDVNEVDELTNELNAYDWQNKLTFLHVPKVEVIPSDWSVRAIAIKGGAEMVGNMVQNGMFNVKPKMAPQPKVKIISNETVIKDKSDIESQDIGTRVKPNAEPDVNTNNNELKSTITNENKSEIFTVSNLDAPIGHNHEIKSYQIDATNVKSDNIEDLDSLDNFDFVEIDTNDKNETDFKALDNIDSDDLNRNISGDDRDDGSDVANMESKTQYNDKTSELKPVYNAKPKLKFYLPKIEMSGFRLPIKMILGLLILAVLLGGGYLLVEVYPKAVITVKITQNQINQPITFTIDPKFDPTKADSHGLVLTGEAENLTEAGAVDIPVTGSKTVGDRAKGKVFIYNRTLSAKSFPSGTVIKNNTAKYTLDTSVTIASASSTTGDNFSTTIDPSKEEVSVTASEIGEAYNLAKDKKLTVANLGEDSFVAVVSQAISGGTSKKVKAVSKVDADNAKKQLIERTTATLKERINTQGLPQVLIGTPTLITQEYSAKIGDEAEVLRLNGNMSQSSYKFDENRIKEEAAVAYNQINPATMIKDSTAGKIITSQAVVENEKAVVNVVVSFGSIPVNDPVAFAKVIAGKKAKNIENYRTSVINFAGYTIDESRMMVGGFLPLNPSNIKIKFKPLE